MDKHLVIFVETPIQNEFDKEELKKNQLSSYLSAMEHIASITSKISASKHVYYDSFIENDSFFNDEFYQKKVHKSNSVKQQLLDALKESFGQWAKKSSVFGNQFI
jgi:hypothetical protein